jgi:hypothetical protein
VKLKPPAFALKKSSQGVLRFSDSGRWLAQVTSRAVVWDVPARRELTAIKAIRNEHHVAFHEPSRRIAIKNSNGELAFCDLESGRTTAATGKFAEFRMGCAPWFSADGKWLLDGHHQGRLLLWDTATAALAHHWDLGARSISDIAHHAPSGRFAFVGDLHFSDARSIGLLGQATPDAVPELRSAADFGVPASQWWDLEFLQFSPDGERLALVARPQDRHTLPTIQVLDLGASARVWTAAVGRGEYGWTRSLAWSAGGQLIAVFQENSWRPGMSTQEHLIQKAGRVEEWIEVFDAATGAHLQSHRLPGLSRVAAAPGSAAIALNSAEVPGALLASVDDLPAYAAAQLARARRPDR